MVLKIVDYESDIASNLLYLTKVKLRNRFNLILLCCVYYNTYYKMISIVNIIDINAAFYFNQIFLILFNNLFVTNTYMLYYKI